MLGHRRRTTLLVASILGALGLALVLRGPGDAAPARSVATSGVPMTVPSARSATSPPPFATSEFGVTALRERLEEYKRGAIYPWWSRPHDDGSRYLLDWNQQIVGELPFSDEKGNETSCHFAADKMHVPFGEALTSWIEVWKTGQKTQRVPATIRQAWVMAVDGAPGRLMELAYQDDGELRYTNRFVPSEHKALATSRQVRLVAEVEAGGQTRLLVRDFTYAPRDVLRVVGFSDAIVDGSLAITLEVDVLEAGVYTFQANLGSGDEQVPLGWSEIGASLAVGRAKVNVVFFGKLLHDSAQAGPYLVRDVRGFLHKDDAEHNIWWSYPGSYRTRPYRATDFSASEWDSTEKREKLQSMQEIIDKTANGELSGAGPAPHIHIGEDGVARQVSP